MRNKLFRICLIIIMVVSGFIIYLKFKPAPTLSNFKREDPNISFQDFYLRKLNQSKEKGVRAENQEKLLIYDEGVTDLAILYIHGFGACRAEGEFVTDSIASKLNANTYYLRLPGHGTNREDHASSTFSDYICEAEEALAMMPKLGKKIIVIGTSMGGMLATYLAATYPDKVDALILVSPFYDYAHVAGGLVNIPGMVNLVAILDRKGRVTLPVQQIKDGYILPEYENFWYTEQKYEALLSLEDLKDFAATPKIYSKVTAPTLMFYYYKNEEEQDNAACVKTMLEAFDQFGKATKPNHLNKRVKIENGDHVMFSKYINNDKTLIYKELTKFIESVFEVKIQDEQGHKTLKQIDILE
ncbi:MAG: alpha/beta hydrolase [Bacteroidota bacterium]|nr:alpha/beta hydrolase [Bacteroidota bacterium]